MSRIHFSDEEPDDTASMLRGYAWEANRERQLKGKKGQAFMRELLAALEALPEKRLIRNAVACAGQVCTLGALALKRRTDAGEAREEVLADLSKLRVDLDDDSDLDELEDDNDVEMAAWARDALACPSLLSDLIPHETDDYDVTVYDAEGNYNGRRAPTPEELYAHMHAWVKARIVEAG